MSNYREKENKRKKKDNQLNIENCVSNDVKANMGVYKKGLDK